MRYIILARYSHNDSWTEIELRDEEQMESEILYKVKQGWEVKISDDSKLIYS